MDSDPVSGARDPKERMSLCTIHRQFLRVQGDCLWDPDALTAWGDTGRLVAKMGKLQRAHSNCPVIVRGGGLDADRPLSLRV